jgi:hypothetical protein
VTLAEGLFSRRVRWGRVRLATQAPEQVASHDVGDHAQQHQKHRDPKNPAVVHPLPASTMRMSIAVFVIMSALVHGFLRKLRIRKEEVRISAEPADDPCGLLLKTA